MITRKTTDRMKIIDVCFSSNFRWQKCVYQAIIFYRIQSMISSRDSNEIHSANALLVLSLSVYYLRKVYFLEIVSLYIRGLLKSRIPYCMVTLANMEMQCVIMRQHNNTANSHRKPNMISSVMTKVNALPVTSIEHLLGEFPQILPVLLL